MYKAPSSDNASQAVIHNTKSQFLLLLIIYKYVQSKGELDRWISNVVKQNKDSSFPNIGYPNNPPFIRNVQEPNSLFRADERCQITGVFLIKFCFAMLEDMYGVYQICKLVYLKIDFSALYVQRLEK